MCCHTGAPKGFTKQAMTHLMINETKTSSRKIYGNRHSQASVIKRHQANFRNSERSDPQYSHSLGYLGDPEDTLSTSGLACAAVSPCPCGGLAWLLCDSVTLFSWDTPVRWDPSWEHPEWCRSAGMSGTNHLLFSSSVDFLKFTFVYLGNSK